jgi:hypothetical protein
MFISHGLRAVSRTSPIYIEDVFSTYLYTGNGSTQTITNGIDLAGEGGLVWIKSRSAATNHFLFDTARGALNEINGNNTEVQASLAASLTGFNTTGFALGEATGINVNTATYTSWTFRKQPKFFDIVTYTGNGATQTINHNLGSTPGMIIVKNITVGDGWRVWTNALTVNEYLTLNDTSGKLTASGIWGSSLPNSTTFQLGAYDNNRSGGTYVAYLFAHDDGGFGSFGTDNGISCGSYTGNGSANGNDVTLGYEPQWLMVKRAVGGTGNWQIIDNMRGNPVGRVDALLQSNLNAAETSVQHVTPTATGFQLVSTNSDFNTNSSTYIYIAIRRGLMKVPTDATKVFTPVIRSGTGTNLFNATGAGFPPDMTIMSGRNLVGFSVPSSYQNSVIDRLRRATEHIQTININGEGGGWGGGHLHSMDGYDGLYTGDASYYNASSGTYVDQHFRRASGFFDVVCYTGTGANRTVEHNLGVVPELMIVKRRNGSSSWGVYAAPIGNTKYLQPNTTDIPITNTLFWNDTSPTNAVFTVGTNTTVNASGGTYVAYLFASCPGVSKIGSYTGNGSSQTINCGFAAGARFVMIKRTDSIGDWYFWDSARGIVEANDPHLSLNTADPEVTTNDSVDPVSTGFIVNQVAATNINVTSATYIFLAIA